MRKGFFYLVAVVDLMSKHVLSWKLSNSLDIKLCLEALEMAVASGRKPQIFRSVKGCQSTSKAFMGHLNADEIEISWSGRKGFF
nr:DDE-type integrase/transposase/recombinase [Synechococcus sp. CCY 0621]